MFGSAFNSTNMGYYCQVTNNRFAHFIHSLQSKSLSILCARICFSLSLSLHFSLNKYALISICTFNATLECNYELICKVNLSSHRLNKMNTNNSISNRNMHSSLWIICTMWSNVKIHNRMIRPNDLKWRHNSVENRFGNRNICLLQI